MTAAGTLIGALIVVLIFTSLTGTVVANIDGTDTTNWSAGDVNTFNATKTMWFVLGFVCIAGPVLKQTGNIG